MAEVTLTLCDTPQGGVSIHTTFTPAIGQPCTPAQGAALEMISRTRKQWGVDAVAASCGQCTNCQREVQS